MIAVARGLVTVVAAALLLPAQAPPAERQLEGIAYRTGPDLDDHARERCCVDLYVPAAAPGFATVVWFHGGGLTGGRRGIPRALHEQGIAVVGAGYRLSPHVEARVCLQDAAAAVAWTLAHIADYGGDPTRVFVAGHSAGGWLASMLGLDKRWLAAVGVDADRIAGVIPFSGHAITHFTVRKERGIADTQPVVDDMAPLFHVREDAPPLLLLTGDREREMLGRYEEVAYLWRMLRVVGHPDVQLRELPGTDHDGMVAQGMPLLLEFVRQRGARPAPREPTGR